MKIKQNPCSVARKQGLAKIRNCAPGVDFWFHFGSHVGAFGHHFRALSSFFAFCFAALFFDTLKYAKRPIGEQTDHAEVASGPPKRMLQHGVKASKKTLQLENASACTSAGTVADILV